MDNSYKLYGIVGLLLVIFDILIMFKYPFIGCILGIISFILSALGKGDLHIFITNITAVLSIMVIFFSLLLFINYSNYKVDGDKISLFMDKANILEEYIRKQYDLSIRDRDNYFKNICGDDGRWCIDKEILFRVNDVDKLLVNSGLSSYDFDLNNSYFKVNKDYSVCVKLYSSSTSRYSNIHKSIKSNGCKKLKFL